MIPQILYIEIQQYLQHDQESAMNKILVSCIGLEALGPFLPIHLILFYLTLQNFVNLKATQLQIQRCCYFRLNPLPDDKI